MSDYIPTPTSAEVVRECANIQEYVNEEITFTQYIAKALTDVKRYLRNMRGIDWDTVFTVTAGYASADNEDNIKTAIKLMTISVIYKDNATATDGDPFWQLASEYGKQALQLLDTAKLDLYPEIVDISSNTTTDSGQRFLRA